MIDMHGGEEQHFDDAAVFSKYLHMKGKMSYVARLTLSAGIGGLLFGYDIGSMDPS